MVFHWDDVKDDWNMNFGSEYLIHSGVHMCPFAAKEVKSETDFLSPEDRENVAYCLVYCFAFGDTCITRLSGAVSFSLFLSVTLKT